MVSSTKFIVASGPLGSLLILRIGPCLAYSATFQQGPLPTLPQINSPGKQKPRQPQKTDGFNYFHD